MLAVAEEKHTGVALISVVGGTLCFLLRDMQ